MLATITIRIINDLTDCSSDEIYYIRRCGTDQVTVEFISSTNIYTIRMSLDDVTQQWFPVLLDSLMCDDEPAAAIQLDIPCLPTILVRTLSLHAAKH